MSIANIVAGLFDSYRSYVGKKGEGVIMSVIFSEPFSVSY